MRWKGKIRYRLLRGCSLILMLVIFLGGYSIFFSQAMEEQVSFLGKISAMGMDIERLRMAALQVQQHFSQVAATGQVQGLKEAEEEAERFKGYLADIHRRCDRCHIQVFAPSGEPPDVRGEIEEMERAFSSFYSLGSQMVQAYLREEREVGNRLMEELDRARAKIFNRLDRWTKMARDYYSFAWEGISRSTDRAKQISLWGTLAAILSGIVLSVIIASGIDQPINRLVNVANRIAQGDLTVEDLRINSLEELGSLAQALTLMKNALNEMIGKVMEAALRVTTASTQLSATSEEIAQGAEEQSNRAAQVATASEEMSATIVEVAKNASGAAEAAREASQVAFRGGQIVSRTIESMHGIAHTTRESSQVIATLGERSQEIGKIIRVIDDIADQTNLLALNAAIEAARAGEQGRGFAVVADEVRKLAERTTRATKEIAEMIKAIQDDIGKALTSMEHEVKVVEEGVGFAQEAGKALEKIVEQVEKVTAMIQQIATAAEEQSTAADQISGDIETVANITKETASGAQQIAQASQEISRLAANLQSMVAKFKIREGEGPPAETGKEVEYLLEFPGFTRIRPQGDGSGPNRGVKTRLIRPWQSEATLAKAQQVPDNSQGTAENI